MRICSIWQSWRSRRSTWRSWSLIVFVIPCLIACAGAPPPPLKVAVSAASDINPDARQRPSPVTVRVYLLKSVAAFSSADFLSLFSKEQATLGADLLQKEEFQIRPSEKMQLSLTVPNETKHIAVMSAFRDVARAQWRDTQPVPATQHSWSVHLNGRNVQLIQSP